MKKLNYKIKMNKNHDDKFPLRLDLTITSPLFKQLRCSHKQIEKIILNQSDNVGEFSIPKKNSSDRRLIRYPKFSYKKILRKLNKFLLKRSHFIGSVLGGVPGKNLSDMVKPHCGKEMIYQIDIENFYPSISLDMIYNIFVKSGCSEEVSYLLSRFVTLDNYVPQGFPTSSTLANLVLHKVDFDHENICKSNIARTRWIDDIIFSGRTKDLKPIIHKIDSSVTKNGFNLAKEKRKTIWRQNKNKEMIVVGLDIRKHSPAVPNNAVEKIALLIHAVNEIGVENTYELFREEFNPRKKVDVLKSIVGKINHVKQYSEEKANYLTELYDSILC